jgi:TolA-binding protein
MDVDSWVAIIIALIGAAAGIGGLIRQALRDKPDIAAQYEQMAERQAMKIQQMQARIDALTGEIEELKQALEERDRLIQAWQAGIRMLIDQLTANEIIPVWMPKEKADKTK